MEVCSVQDEVKSDIISKDDSEKSIHDQETSKVGEDTTATTPPGNVQGAKEKTKGEPTKDGLKIRRKRKYRKNRSDNARIRKKEKEDGREIVPPPLNTTQFLMSDYNYNKFSPEVKLDDYSRDNAVDFLLKEFSKEYENTNCQQQKRMEMRSQARCDRMATLSRDDLIHKYMQMDNEVKMLEMRLVMVQEDEDKKFREGQVEYDWRKGEVHMEPETAQKIQVFQNEIAKLDSENKGLASGEINSSEGARGENGEEETGWTSDSSSDSNSSSSSDESTSSGDSDSSTRDEVQSSSSKPSQDFLTGHDADADDEEDAISDKNVCDLVNGIEESSCDLVNGFEESSCDPVNGIEESTTITDNCTSDAVNGTKESEDDN